MSARSQANDAAAAGAANAVAAAPAATLPMGLRDPQLQCEVEQFLYLEAKLLDDRRFAEWVALMADDVRYFMPVRTNRSEREARKEFSGDRDLAYFDESKTSLLFRWRKLASGQAWAESPPSRTRHLVTNVSIAHGASPGELRINSAFLLYRSRLARQVDVFAGERRDLLRRVDTAAGFEIANRCIILDEATVGAANLSIFF